MPPSKNFRLDPRIRPTSYEVTYLPHPILCSIPGEIKITIRVATDFNDAKEGLQRSSYPHLKEFLASSSEINEITLHSFNTVTHHAEIEIFRLDQKIATHVYNADTNSSLVSCSRADETITFKLPQGQALAIDIKNHENNKQIKIVATIRFCATIQKNIPHGKRSEGFFFSNEVGWSDVKKHVKQEMAAASKKKMREKEVAANPDSASSSPSPAAAAAAADVADALLVPTVDDLINIELALAKLSALVLHKGKSVEEQETKMIRDLWTITSQLEPCNARRIAPMFDEPSYRATWKMNLILPTQVTALSFAERPTTRKSLTDFFGEADEKNDLKSFLLSGFTKTGAADSFVKDLLTGGNDNSLFRPHETTGASLATKENENAASTTTTTTTEWLTGALSAYSVMTFDMTNPSTSSSSTPATIPPHIFSIFTSPENGFRILQDTIPARKVKTFKKIENFANNNDGDRLKLVDVDAPAVPISVFVPNGVSLSSAKFPLDVMKRVVLLIEDLFKCPLPPPLLQLVPSSEFSSLGMENWGLLLMQSEYLFVTDNDPSSSSSSRNGKNHNNNTPIERTQRIARLIAHETLHQWFGDNVAPEYWDQVWSKEGVVRFFEYICCQNLFPEWNLFGNFYDDITKGALVSDKEAFDEDAKKGFHESPEKFKELMDLAEAKTNNTNEDKKDDEVDSSSQTKSKTQHQTPRQRVIAIPSTTHPRIVMDLFDNITYGKAGSVLRMIYDTFGHDIFVEGFARFQCLFAWSHARLDNLCECLEDAYSFSTPERRLAFQKTGAPRWPVIDGSAAPTTNNNNKISLRDLFSIMIDHQIGHAVIEISDVKEDGSCIVGPPSSSSSSSSASFGYTAVPPAFCHKSATAPPLLVPVFLSPNNSNNNSDDNKDFTQLCFWDCRPGSASFRISAADEDNHVESSLPRIARFCPFGPYRFVAKPNVSSPSSAKAFIKGLMSLSSENVLNAPHIFETLVLDCPTSLNNLEDIAADIHEDATRDASMKKMEQLLSLNKSSSADSTTTMSVDRITAKLKEKVIDVQRNSGELGLSGLESWIEIVKEEMKGKSEKFRTVHPTFSRPALETLHSFLKKLVDLAASAGISEAFSTRVRKLYASIAEIKFAASSSTNSSRNNDNNNSSNANDADDASKPEEEEDQDLEQAHIHKNISSYCHHTKWSWKENLSSSLHSFYLCGLQYSSSESGTRIRHRLLEAVTQNLVDVAFGKSTDDSDDDEDDEDEDNNDHDQEDEEGQWMSSSNSLFPDALSFVSNSAHSSRDLCRFILGFSRHLLQCLELLNPELTVENFQRALNERNRMTESAASNSALALLDMVASDLVSNFYAEAQKYARKEENTAKRMSPAFSKIILGWCLAFVEAFVRQDKFEKEKQQGLNSASFVNFTDKIDEYFAIKVAIVILQQRLPDRLASVLGSSGEGSSVMVNLFAFDRNWRRACYDRSLDIKCFYVRGIGGFCSKYARKRFPIAVRELFIDDSESSNNIIGGNNSNNSSNDVRHEKNQELEVLLFRSVDQWVEGFLKN